MTSYTDRNMTAGHIIKTMMSESVKGFIPRNTELKIAGVPFKLEVIQGEKVVTLLTDGGLNVDARALALIYSGMNTYVKHAEELAFISDPLSFRCIREMLIKEFVTIEADTYRISKTINEDSDGLDLSFCKLCNGYNQNVYPLSKDRYIDNSTQIDIMSLPISYFVSIPERVFTNKHFVQYSEVLGENPYLSLDGKFLVSRIPDGYLVIKGANNKQFTLTWHEFDQLTERYPTFSGSGLGFEEGLPYLLEYTNR